MGFLRERRETNLARRRETGVSHGLVGKVCVGTRRVSRERHVLYGTEQVWSRMSRETGLARRDHGLAVSSRVSSRSEMQLYRSMRAA